MEVVHGSGPQSFFIITFLSKALHPRNGKAFVCFASKQRYGS
jgi:hypothetical protein